MFSRHGWSKFGRRAHLGAKLPQPAFFGKVPLRIVIQDAGKRVHLPVLFSPWGFSFYRGS